MFSGQCHCANVQLTIPSLTETGTTCTCSLCSRYGVVWGYFVEAEVDVTVGEHGITPYCQGDKQLNTFHCNQCGCVTHYSLVNPEPDTRIAINYRMFGASVMEQLDIKVFDGADTWKYLD